MKKENKKFNEIKGEFTTLNKAQTNANIALSVIVKMLLNLEINDENAKQITKINYKETGYDAYFWDYEKPTQKWLMNQYTETTKNGFSITVEYPSEINITQKA